MKACIVGAGAIGGWLGVRLAQCGCDVSVLARGAAAEALRRHDWRLDIGGETLSAPVRVIDTPAAAAPQDLVVIALKGPGLPEVASKVSPLIGADTVVLSAMNGVPWWFFRGFDGPLANTQLDTVDPDGRIGAAIPDAAVIGSVVYASCSVTEPGRVRHGSGNRLIIGEPAGGETPRLTALADLLRRAGCDVVTSRHIQSDIWYKLWGNMTMNPVSALTGATCDRILDDPLVNQFCRAVMAEAAALGARIGCPIEQSGAERMAETRKLGPFKTSMLQDLEAGKTLEIDGLLTVVREIATKIGMATPHIDTLLGLVRLMASTRGLYP